MHDGGDLVFGEQRGYGLAVGDVAGHDGDPGAERGQLGGEVVGAGRGGTAASGQHEVRCAAAGEQAGDLCAERAGATGDEHGSAGAPMVHVRTTRRGAADPAGVQAGAADGYLVLGAVGENPGQPLPRAPVHRLREVDQAAPAARQLQCGDAAEAPHLCLVGVGRRIELPDRHRAGRDGPQWSFEPGGVERLDEHDGGGEAGRDARVVRVVGHAGADEGQHPGEVVGLLGDLQQVGGERPRVGVGRVEAEGAHLRARRAQHRREVGSTAGGIIERRDEQPRAGEPCDRRVGDRPPPGLVAPGVHNGLFGGAAAPRRQGRQDGVERAGVDPECACHDRGVVALDRGPEPGFVLTGDGGRRGQVGGERVEPVPLPLERVGRQGNPVPAGHRPRPVDAGAPDPGLRQPCEERPHLVVVAAGQRGRVGDVRGQHAAPGPVRDW